ncbi:peptide deformylase [Rhizobium sp. SEMIA 4085]|uniref:Peptide deformylase-like n=1 Tax=Rhizobium gallicum bv. gallicum R602sp TaxID=1041138 RepID=A0A0B4X3R3_9HYPH|nr:MULTISPECIES: peptide deformylase [Rhizobium]AJD41350.1 peptide deformylase protein [Rhizobium gallicum bv. gallicum R602sp]NNH30259.1 peptide deformylase [Rhizobium sp. SEMIA 4085]
MAIRPILRYPHPGLKTICEPVTVFDWALRRLADDLLETMRVARGVGITAAHVGVFLRVVVIELNKVDGVRTFINPDIISVSDELMRQTEGSVSMPGVTDEVTRPRAVRFRYQDINGVQHEEHADGFLAICIQHEVDQLDGIFWLQRLSKLKRDRLIRKWEKAAP